MTTLVVGDIHGCADELRELLHKVGPSRVISVGDLFTKGPDPVDVWRVVKESKMEAVLGNHDDRLLRAVDGGRSEDKAAFRVIERLNGEDPTWLSWVRSLPLTRREGGFVVVHASLHSSGIEATTREMALVWRRWPLDAPDAPRWHTVFRGEESVVFGHDAVGGLVRREKNGKPWLIGLDTGCVYGGHLTGYCFESDQFIQVRARRVYKSIH